MNQDATTSALRNAYQTAVGELKRLEQRADQLKTAKKDAEQTKTQADNKLLAAKKRYNSAMTQSEIQDASAAVQQATQSLDDAVALIANIDRALEKNPAAVTEAREGIGNARVALLEGYASGVISDVRSNPEFDCIISLLCRAYAARVNAGYARQFGFFLAETFSEVVPGVGMDTLLPSLIRSKSR